MKRALFALCVVCFATLSITAARHQLVRARTPAPFYSQPEGSALTRGDVLTAYGKLPLNFEANQGQTDPRVRFVAQGSGYAVFLTGDDATLLLHAPCAENKISSSARSALASNSKSSKCPAAAVRLALAGASPRVEIEALDAQSGTSNYLTGNDPSKWRRGIPHFARIKYHGVYPGVDLVYYGNQGRLESDYVLAPGAVPSQIGMRIKGADQFKLDSQGNAIFSTAVGDVTLHRPRAYQRIAGGQLEIAANYVRRGRRLIGIEVAPYDASQPLIIDPVLSYSTYLGGTTNQVLAGIAADSSGFAYVTGFTSSADFPTTTGALQTKLSNTSSNALIVKLKQDGTGLVYSTVLGGTGVNGDSARAIAVDAAGDAYIVGFTSSSDFPVRANAYQSVNKGGGGFFSKLDPTGSTLIYSSYLNGSGTDLLNAIALDANGNAYITGSTTSTDFPVVIATALQNTNKVTGSSGTAFLSRIDPSQSGTNSLIYSTYLGGSKGDSGQGVKVDSAFHAYVVGFTSSTDFPQPTTPNGYQLSLRNPSGNIFLADIDTTQPALLLYSTYLGGTGNGGSTPGDVGTAIAVPSAGLAYITGYTSSTSFPTVNPLSTTSNAPLQKAIIAKIDTTKTGVSSLLFSTYFGGSVATLGSTQPGADLGLGIAVDTPGNIYVTGTTKSADFPVTPGAPQPTRVGTQNAFLSELNPSGSTVLFSTYLGGTTDVAASVALDTASPANAYIAGASAGNFPTTVGAFQITDLVAANTNGNTDGFVSKISPGAVAGVFASPAFVSFTNQVVHTPSAAQTVTLYNNSGTTLSGITVSFTGANAGDFTEGTSTCSTTLATNSTCTIGIIFTPSTNSTETAALSIADSASGSPQIVSLVGSVSVLPTAVFLAPTTVAFGNQTINSTSPAQTVTLTNNSAATVTSISITIGGVSSALFAQTNNCGSTLAVGANCTIRVTFSPTIAGAATASLSVSDSDAGSPQTAVLTGTGTTGNPDFGIAAMPTTASVAAGSTANFTVTVTGLNGFTTPVALTCAGAPIDSACALTPSTVTPTATGAMSTGAVVTTMRTMAPPAGRLFRGPHYPTSFWLLSFTGLLLTVWLLVRRQPAKKLAWAFALLLLASQTGCSGLPHHGTPAGIYTLTITGTAGTLTHQVTVSLTVT
jgi:hypothetical protein